jgi:hypothetical protein
MRDVVAQELGLRDASPVIRDLVGIRSRVRGFQAEDGAIDGLGLAQANPCLKSDICEGGPDRRFDVVPLEVVTRVAVMPAVTVALGLPPSMPCRAPGYPTDATR